MKEEIETVSKGLDELARITGAKLTATPPPPQPIGWVLRSNKPKQEHHPWFNPQFISKSHGGRFAGFFRRDLADAKVFKYARVVRTYESLEAIPVYRDPAKFANLAFLQNLDDDAGTK